MKTFDRAADLRALATRWRRAALSVGFVPTLGGLHGGHLSLVRRARAECDRVSVSVYLNPTQFDSASDLASYPASIERDLELLAAEDVDAVLIGRRADFLPEGFESSVTVAALTERLCGAYRSGHFRGVTTVVAQLLHFACPHRAYFGRKDFQQARVIERMVRDLAFDCEIRTAPTVREADGLAMSSRNARLTPEQRRAAPELHRALVAGRDALLAGERSSAAIEGVVTARLEAEPRFRIDYVECLDAASLARFAGDRIDAAPGGVLIAAAVHVGATRLIDNEWVESLRTAASADEAVERANETANETAKEEGR